MNERKLGGGTIRSLGNIDEVFALDGVQRFRADHGRHFSMHSDRSLLVRGWAIDPQTRQPARRATFHVDGMPVGIVRYGILRADVADSFQDSNLAYSGFSVVVDAEKLGTGHHTAEVVLDDGASSLPPFTFEVSNATPLDVRSTSSGQYDFEVTAFHTETDSPATIFRIEFGLPGVVRGTIAALERAAIAEVLAVVDSCWTFPVHWSRETASVFFCLPTGDLEHELTLGKHWLRLAIKYHGDRAHRLTRPIAFDVVPLCVHISVPRLSPRFAEAEISFLGCDGGEPALQSFGRGEIACVRGWAVDPDTRDSMASAELCFENDIRVRMEMRQLRSDVPLNDHAAGAAYCGFVGNISMEHLSLGTNVARLFATSKDGTTRYRTKAELTFEIHP